MTTLEKYLIPSGGIKKKINFAPNLALNKSVIKLTFLYTYSIAFLIFSCFFLKTQEIIKYLNLRKIHITEILRSETRESY